MEISAVKADSGYRLKVGSTEVDLTLAQLKGLSEVTQACYVANYHQGHNPMCYSSGTVCQWCNMKRELWSDERCKSMPQHWITSVEA